MAYEPDRAEFYEHEAERLRRIADSVLYRDLRDDLLNIARQYEALARQTREMKRSVGTG